MRGGLDEFSAWFFNATNFSVDEAKAQVHTKDFR
jgi:hypothetical protein